MSSHMPPLAGLHVVNLGAGMSCALIAKFLHEAGAKVITIEPESGDPFVSIYPAYGVWRSGQEVRSAGALELGALLDSADICIVGGESHPDLDCDHSAEKIALERDRLIVLEITGYPGLSDITPGPAVDILAQARSGLCWDLRKDQPMLSAFAAPTYGSVLAGLIGVCGALYERERSGRGQTVNANLFHGCQIWCAGDWMDIENPHGRPDISIPKDAVQLIFCCRDGLNIQLVLGSAGSKGQLYELLKIEGAEQFAGDAGIPTGENGPRNFFGDIDLIARHIADWDSGPLLQALWAAGIAAEPVLPPGACWDEPQMAHNGTIATQADGIRHVGMPIRLHCNEGGLNRKASPSAPQRPLSDIRVVDLGAFVAGPYASIPLVDLGADVIKVEPLQGAAGRGMFRAFAAVTRGKRSIAVNLKDSAGLQVVQRLCEKADIVQHNFRPGVAERLGVDYEALRKINRDIVVTSCSGYGATGPKALQGGFDQVFQALCGHDHRAGGGGNPPFWNRFFFVDYATGMLGALGTLLALLRLARQGGGAEVDASLLDSGTFLISELIQQPDGTWQGVPTLNTDATGFHPAEHLYPAQDGWIAIAARNDFQAHRLAQLLDLDIHKPRAEWGSAEEVAIAAAIAQRPAGLLLAELEEAGVWAEPCCENGWRQLVENVETRVNGAVVETTSAGYGEVQQLGSAFTFSRSLKGKSQRVPDLGENTREILLEAGYSAMEIDDLITKGVVA